MHSGIIIVSTKIVEEGDVGEEEEGEGEGEEEEGVKHGEVEEEVRDR